MKWRRNERSMHIFRERLSAVPAARQDDEQKNQSSCTPSGGRRLHRLRSGHRGSGGNGFVHFLQRFFVPQAAAVRGELSPSTTSPLYRPNSSLKSTKTDQHHRTVFSARRSLCRSALHTRQVLFAHPAKGFAVRFVDIGSCMASFFRNRSNSGGFS